ncbi:MAG: hypothetical protein ACM3IL_01795 [Deltaproteobacteria bacterium]
MDKKKFPEELPNLEANLAPKKAGLSGWFFGFTKFILGICALPVVYAVSAGFLNEFTLVEKGLQRYFWNGVITMLILYLFAWEPAIIYSRGQRLLEFIFNFLKPLVRVAPFLLPVYTIIIFLAYLVYFYVFKVSADYLIFLFGLTITLHLIFSAKTMRAKKGDFLKGNYIFGFSLIYIINTALLASFFSVIFPKFSFVNFCSYSFQTAKDIFGAVFSQLFS